MSFPAKGGSQLSGWQIASSRDSFCDFGRKLENLSVSVGTQWCSATDGRTRQHRVMDDSLLPFTSLQENLTQTHLDFSYFRTTEPKLLRLCARRHSQAYETPFGWATHVSTNQYLVWSPWNEKKRKRQAFHNLPLSLILQPAARWLFPPAFPQQW